MYFDILSSLRARDTAIKLTICMYFKLHLPAWLPVGKLPLLLLLRGRYFASQGQHVVPISGKLDVPFMANFTFDVMHGVS